jgi:hypothetical protein
MGGSHRDDETRYFDGKKSFHDIGTRGDVDCMGPAPALW